MGWSRDDQEALGGGEMADRETSVRYRALADFAALNRTLRAAKRNIAELRKEEERLNATTAAGEARSAAAVGKHAKSREDLIDSIDKEASSIQKSTANFIANAKAIRETEGATRSSTRAQEELGQATQATEATTRRARREQEQLANGTKKAEEMTRRQRREMERLAATQARAGKGVNQFYSGLKKLENWRPRLTPPFVVLIPLIAGLLALMNPLVAGIGALTMAGFGLAASFGSAASVLVTGLIPGIATAIGLVASLKAAFNGIGGAFKAATAMRNAAGGGGGGGGGGAAARIEISAAEKLTRAQRELAEATQDVLFAQEDLDDERADYIKRLNALTKAVQRAAMAEARAAANSQLAKEDYANTLADPGSTKGQKMDAGANVAEAAADYNDVLEENVANQADLNEMQQKGIEGDRQVIMATRALTDALDRQRDAQISLANAQRDTNQAMGSGGGGAGVADEYQKMLNKLSPSARKFVETIVGLQDQWEAMRRTVQESFFSEIVDDLGLIQTYIAPVGSMLGSIAGAAGRVFDKFLKLTTSSAWLQDIVTFGKDAAPVIETIGDGLLSLVDSFRNITLAAMPFLLELSNGFKEGAANFANFVADARETGSLAAWLEQGRLRLAQWWRVIKNIGQTLYNYGVAAGPFSDWLTDGLENITKSWLDNSEEAKKAGSPFKKYLEDIKPLLSEIRGLVGDFFSWLSDEAMDPDNIKQMTDIFRTIREDIGPDIRKIFDSLSDAKIGPKLIEVFGKITELIATVLENGGAGTLVSFFNVVGGLLDAFSTLASSPGGGAIITTVGLALAGMAALSFVGQFTGLTALLGAIINFAKGGGLKTLSALASGLKGTTAGSAVTGAASAVTTKVAPAAATAAGGITGLLGKAGSFLKVVGGKLALPILVVTSVAETVGNAVSSIQNGQSAASKVKPGSTPQEAVHQVNSGFAADGNMAKVASPGLGIISEIVGLFSGEAKTAFDNWLAEVSVGLMDFFTIELPGFVAEAGANIWDGIQGIGEWFQATWEEAGIWLADLPFKVGFAVGAIWGNIQNFGAWLGEKWAEAVVWLQGLPGMIGTAVGNIWSGIQGFGVWLATVAWPAAVAWFQNLPQNIANAAGNIWRAIQGVGPWLATIWTGFLGWLSTLPSKISTAAGNVWGMIQGVGTWLAKMWTDIQTWAAGLPRKIADTIGNLFKYVTASFTAGVDAGAASKKKHYGGIIRRAGGGTVPGRGNSDTVRAMLTPGEVVMKTSVVDAMGADNADRFARGLMSYSEMLNVAMSSQPNNSKREKKSGNGGVSFFSGGGLVVSRSETPGGGGYDPDPRDFGGAPGGNGGGMTFGDIHIHNPEPEPASDSLPRTIRKIAYIGRGGRDED